MRFLTLELENYGPFSARGFEFDTAGPGFHLFLGPNEAGKSTLHRAILDYLFGFPPTTRGGFVGSQTRVRASLGFDDGTERIRVRRKTSKQDWEDQAGVPHPNEDLPGLAQLDREAFSQLYGLDPARFLAGIEDLSQGRGDLGKLLFKLQSGVDHLEAGLQELAGRARDIYVSKRSKQGHLPPALQARAKLETSLKDSLFDPSQFESERRRIEEAEAQQRDLQREIRGLRRAREHAQMALQALPQLERRKQLQGQIRDLDGVPLFESRELEELSNRLERLRTLRVQVQGLEVRFEDLEAKAEALAGDLPRMAAKAQLDRLVSVLENLPKREQALTHTRHRQEDLEAKTKELQAALPEPLSTGARKKLTETEVPRLRSLQEALQSGQDTLRERLSQTQDLARQLRELERQPRQKAAIAPEPLRRLGQRLHSLLETQRRTQAEQKKLQGTVRALDERAQKLGLPATATNPEVPRWTLSDRDQLEADVARARELRSKLEHNQERIQEAQDRLEAARDRSPESSADLEVLDQAHLEAARQDRGQHWVPIRAHLEGRACLPEAKLYPLLDRFQDSIQSADSLADQRFLAAEALAQMEQARRQLEELERDKQRREETQADLMAQLEPIQARLLAARKKALNYAGPDSRLGSYLDQLELFARDLGELQERRKDHQGIAKDLESQIRTWADELPADLSNPDLDSLEGILSELESRAQRAEAAAESQRNFKARRTTLLSQLSEVQLRTRNLADALSAKIQALRGDLEGLGLGSFPSLELLETALSQEELGPEVEDRSWREALRGRLQVPEKLTEIAALEEENQRQMRHLEEEQARDLSLWGQFPELGAWQDSEAGRRLSSEIEEANRQAHQAVRRTTLKTEAQKLQEELEDHRIRARAQDQELRVWCESLEVEAVDPRDLEAQLPQLEERRRLEDQLHSLEAELKSLAEKGLKLDAQGFPQVQGLDSNEDLPNRIEELSQDLDRKEEHLATLQQDLGRLEEGLAQRCRADPGAELRQDLAFAEARELELAQEFLGLELARVLIEEELTRLRDEAWSPTLELASEIFRGITHGRYQGLTVQAEESGKMQLEAVLPQRGSRPLDHLSEGTKDQLFLSLCLAGLWNRNQAGESLPFLFDDFLVSFDDARSRACFRRLGTWAESTQVLYFSHHQHFEALAKAEIPKELLRVHRIGDFG